MIIKVKMIAGMIVKIIESIFRNWFSSLFEVTKLYFINCSLVYQKSFFA